MKKEELLTTSFILLLLLLIASCLIYFAEGEAQPDKFSSIPASLWWAVTTLTTVGYGDMYPVTVPGKILGSIIAILGIGVFALPAAIFSMAFLQELESRKKAGQRCPYCGKEINGH